MNKQLRKSGTPPIKIAPEPGFGPGGEFDRKESWVIFDENWVEKPTLSDTDTRELAGVVYHEGRHVEQNFWWHGGTP